MTAVALTSTMAHALLRKRMARARGDLGRLGQVVVEMLLILPVFLTIVFTIMEMGYLAFWVIVLNHATYECARVGALLSTPPDGGDPRNVDRQMNEVMAQFMGGLGARVTSRTPETVLDRQADVTNHDLVVTGIYDVQFVFPISSLLMSSPLLCPGGPGGGRCTIRTTVRMPIERPIMQGESTRDMRGGGGNRFQGTPGGG